MNVEGKLPIWPEVLPVLDTFFALLLDSNEFAELPDLISVLGPEKTIELLDIFGGATIEVPSAMELNRLVRDAGIYAGISRGGETAASLAERHAISVADVERIFERVGWAVKLYGL